MFQCADPVAFPTGAMDRTTSQNRPACSPLDGRSLGLFIPWSRRAADLRLPSDRVDASPHLADAHRLLQRLGHELLELDQVGMEAANAVGQLFGSHGVFVEHPAERLLVEMNLL